MSLRNVFNKNLKAYRKKAGLSQQQLAEQCDIATNYLSEIERGLKFPSIELIERISSTLNTPAYLFFIDDKTDFATDLLVEKRYQEFSEKLQTQISDLLKEYGLLFD